LRKIAFGATEVAFVHVGLSALVIVFSMWWLYFSTDDHLEDDRMHRAFIWGYGHYVVFASGAAVGAGFAVLVDIIDHHAKVSLLVGDYAVAIPVACYMLGLWIIRDLFVCRGRVDRFVLPVFVVLVLLAPVAGLGLEGVAAVTVLAVIVRSVLTSRARAAERG